jgi:hypothetical protein
MTPGGTQLWLRVEGAVVCAGAVAFYVGTGSSWLLFAALFLLPDLGMIGYVVGPRVGAATYNSVHIYAGPALLASAGLIASSPLAISVAAIWAAHIGFDRMLGYGLKSTSGFRHTHLGTIGRD